MIFPIFIFHELVIRLDQVNPGIGRYQYNKQHDESFTLFTGTGSVIVPVHFLKMQFEDPSLINDADLAILATNFKAFELDVK
ncbi:hypothetical protein LPB86_12155 [Pedobacter sp. MC2016-14]|uniref:hypothetical protein n=1 Tax=Pedobacter sp. MC2016-14 TaxID=2897327 RepID=UPI001E46B12C|nr:hypothetical protein [Pedobacter sp. MC2016-14]MCD0488984.1 hypothetical protein [Pedobacter sp. MC2016-14]